MGHLEHISGPQDLRGLDDRALAELASEIRDELIRTCSPRGGHLGPNLGVVELTMAIHRVFESPRDRVIFDTGHQAYVHKMLTGRATRFDTLRRFGAFIIAPVIAAPLLSTFADAAVVTLFGSDEIGRASCRERVYSNV